MNEVVKASPNYTQAIHMQEKCVLKIKTFITQIEKLTLTDLSIIFSLFLDKSVHLGAEQSSSGGKV